ncbi:MULTISPECIES: alpha/beta fold hydrolase [unclassified Gordonia (in: high G+C Gram-positive bacteria)]|uniref:alpha/beta fold hydrolase n=1 Tax=unclassified Gordonia (in: high G+C Gram-positive bacteria) TaxID=2657482 RepID=UPI0009EEA302|nr:MULTISPECIES: alpha/beta fold hydrolase [unclassified Gordonia (in: high G+C Gram-positive bacteria)]
MRSTILFVHGTGVRESRYAATMETICREIARHGLDLAVRGCYWGDAEGAALAAHGASIPGYDEHGGSVPSEADQELTMWSVLELDPWYELRLLRHRPMAGPLPFGQEPPAVALRHAVDQFEPSIDALEHFAQAGLEDFLARAVASLRQAPELDQALATAPPESVDHRRAIARALVAWTLLAAHDEGRPAVNGMTRDRLVLDLTTQLQGDGLGIGDFLLSPVKGLAARMVTRKLTGDRGSITDAAAPMAGDVLRFLAHGSGLRRFLRAAIHDIGRGPVHLLGHSLGGIMCADLLAREKMPSVAGLITVGSQTPFLYEIGAFPALSYPSPLPDHMPPWLNVYDPRDILSYRAEGVFGNRTRDVEVDNGQPFHYSHSAYWTNPALWKAVEQFVVPWGSGG